MATSHTLGKLASLVGGTILSGSPDLPIEELAGVEDAQEGDLTFFDGNAKFKKAAHATRASAMLVKEKLEAFRGAQVQVSMPFLAFQALVNELHPETKPSAGVHPTAVIAPGASVDPTATIGAHVTIEAGATVGGRTVLCAGCYVGRDVVIGEECLFHPNVTLYARTRVGNRVIVHSSAVIGSDGFGYRRDETGHRKIRHVGYAELQDDVEIGAGCTIDRGTYGRTVIGTGAKLDNLVHVAHNVRIGERALVLAQAAMAGGVRIGADAIIGGQAGIADKAVVGEASIVIPQSAVPKRVKPGTIVGGSPIMSHRDFFLTAKAFKYLPALLSRVRAIEKKLGLAAKDSAPDASDGDDQ